MNLNNFTTLLKVVQAMSAWRFVLLWVLGVLWVMAPIISTIVSVYFAYLMYHP